MAPVILVTADVREIDGTLWHAALEPYLTALIGAGAIPLILPSLGSVLELEAALARIDGVLVTGARSNIHPSHYGVQPSEVHEPFDPARDETTLRLIRSTLDLGVPLFAICRGVQELNVALGGTLFAEVQELSGRFDHRAPPDLSPDERFQLAHDVTFDAGSRLADVFGSRTIRVNSAHRQAIDQLAPRLVVEARAEDGTIEAVRVADATAFAYGVQWHPEYWAASDPPSGMLFRAFAKAAHDHAGRAVAHAAE